MIPPVYVTSSNIDAVGYKYQMLYIRFKSGVSYSYENVPHTIFAALQTVESAGVFFNRTIRNKFVHKKLMFDPFVDYSKETA